MFRLIAMILVLLPATAQAQQIFKCVAGSEVSYQSSPCEDGKAPEKTWDHGHYQPPQQSDLQRIEQVQRATRKRNSAATSRPRTARSTTSEATEAKSSIGRCEAAKAHRDRELYKLGPRKSIEALRAWDGYIADACKF